MVERRKPMPEYDIPTVLRRLDAANISKLSLSISFEQYPTSQGLLRTYHVTRVSTIDSLDSKLGKFDLSLDFMRPKTQSDHFDPPLEPEECEYPNNPFYRIRISRQHGKKENSVEFIVDDAFEANAREIHKRLIKGIYKKKKAEGEVEKDGILYVLEALREYEA